MSKFQSKWRKKRIFIDEITAIPDREKAIKFLSDHGEIDDALIVTKTRRIDNCKLIGLALFSF